MFLSLMQTHSLSHWLQTPNCTWTSPRHWIASVQMCVCVKSNGSAAFIGSADGGFCGEGVMFRSSLGNTTVNKSEWRMHKEKHAEYKHTCTSLDVHLFVIFSVLQVNMLNYFNGKKNIVNIICIQNQLANKHYNNMP